MSGPELLQFLIRHRGKILGSVLGLLVALAVMAWGILWTLFICLAVAIGYLAGRYVDGDQEGIGAFLDRLLPPGRR